MKYEQTDLVIGNLYKIAIEFYGISSGGNITLTGGSGSIGNCYGGSITISSGIGGGGWSTGTSNRSYNICGNITAPTNAITISKPQQIGSTGTGRSITVGAGAFLNSRNKLIEYDYVNNKKILNKALLLNIETKSATNYNLLSSYIIYKFLVDKEFVYVYDYDKPVFETI